MNCTLSVAMLLTLAASAAAQVLPACGEPGEHSTHAAHGTKNSGPWTPWHASTILH
jgi:hypothetical protein